EHDHHHDHGPDCTCGCHDHDHHHHDHDHCGCGHDHAADEVFTSWGVETPRTYTEDELTHALTALGDLSLGTVLRAKGIVPAADGGAWLHFDYVPGAPEIRRGAADYTGRLCVIGAELDEARIAALFGVA
ncbi:MAG: GTP-binding protein, partial [Eubacteriales bacterium]|nr:GTP-binding protein [Eubacteriales bacterium]